MNYFSWKVLLKLNSFHGGRLFLLLFERPSSRRGEDANFISHVWVCTCRCARRCARVCVNVNDMRSGGMAKWTQCKMSGLCVCVCVSIYIIAFFFPPPPLPPPSSQLDDCRSASCFAIITSINYESGPGWAGRSRRRHSRGGRFLSCCRRRRQERCFFNFPFINSGLLPGRGAERSSGWKEVKAQSIVWSYNYPTLLGRMIIFSEIVYLSASPNASGRLVDWLVTRAVFLFHSLQVVEAFSERF